MYRVEDPSNSLLLCDLLDVWKSPYIRSTVQLHEKSYFSYSSTLTHIIEWFLFWGDFNYCQSTSSFNLIIQLNMPQQCILTKALLST